MSSHGFVGELFTIRPPFLYGTNFNYSKARMFKSIDHQIWKMVRKWYTPPTVTNKSIQVSKLQENRDANEMKKDSLNDKAINALVCALSFDDLIGCVIIYDQIFLDILEVTHEDTINKMKESKINLLIHSCKLFEMENDESIKDMVSPSNIVNGLKSLDKIYPSVDLVNKILRSLPKTWESKVMAFQEADYFSWLFDYSQDAR